MADENAGGGAGGGGISRGGRPGSIDYGFNSAPAARYVRISTPFNDHKYSHLTPWRPACTVGWRDPDCRVASMLAIACTRSQTHTRQLHVPENASPQQQQCVLCGVSTRQHTHSNALSNAIP